MNYQLILEQIFAEQTKLKNTGVLASYIPELTRINPNKLGVHLMTVNNEHVSVGDWNERFSIQSVAKVFSLILAFKHMGNRLWKRVGVEPSGNAFNSLVQLEYEKGIPRNPFINAGAIVVCDVLISLFANPKKELLQFIRDVSGNPKIQYSKPITESEKSVSYRNHALIHLMKDFGNIENKIEDILDVYFNLCSIMMTCKELAESFLFLARNGEALHERILSVSETKRINSIMQLCGFYDEAGEFSYRVGLPGKSGVGGGIIAISPNKYSVAVWSPLLNKKGNSFKGMNILEQLTTETESSIF